MRTWGAPILRVWFPLKLLITQHFGEEKEVASQVGNLLFTGMAHG
jgi:hypothetical protein